MERRNFPVSSLRLLASPRSSGKTLTFRGESHTIKPLNMNSFEDIDIAIFSAGGAISRDFAPEAVRHGAVVVDNSSAFRMHADVPLVVPEINGADVKNHKGILANPNCTTAITLLALYPLHHTKEEMKMQNEGRRIMHLPNFKASVTCVRTPVYRAHSIAVSAEFEKPVNLEDARAALSKAPGLQFLADGYPMPLDSAGKDDCFAGRLRLDCAMENGLALWVCGDQLLKGAALNAIQIAELL
jgi:aspartate-semialdehyde dehydrogenase